MFRSRLKPGLLLTSLALSGCSAAAGQSAATTQPRDPGLVPRTGQMVMEDLRSHQVTHDVLDTVSNGDNILVAVEVLVFRLKGAKPLNTVLNNKLDSSSGVAGTLIAKGKRYDVMTRLTGSTTKIFEVGSLSSGPSSNSSYLMDLTFKSADLIHPSPELLLSPKNSGGAAEIAFDLIRGPLSSESKVSIPFGSSFILGYHEAQANDDILIMMTPKGGDDVKASRPDRLMFRDVGKPNFE